MTEGIQVSLGAAGTWLKAEVTAPDVVFTGVSTDSRTLKAGNLFVALSGPNHDGHRYLQDAAAAGAAAAMVEHPCDVALPQLIVDDTRRALGRLAAAWRVEAAPGLVAVTGSNGKTTVKEMLAAILGRARPTLATKGNLNNDIGVPLTLLSLEKKHRFAVIEMGANHPGEISYLTAIAKPQVALITNAATAHLEGFGSVEGVARAKGEIFEGLEGRGTAVINADDPHAVLWNQLAGSNRVVTFGLEQPADISARWTQTDRGMRVWVNHQDQEFDFVLPLLGRHNVSNALAAWAAASALGIGPGEIIAGLEAMGPVKGRLNIRAGARGARVIDDTYNANPASSLAGLRVLAGFEGRRVLVLGDMGELGSDAEALHAQVGRDASSLGIDALYATGRLSRQAVEAFEGEGRFYPSREELIEAIRRLLAAEVTLLVKGSRSMGMENVVKALVAEEDQAEA